MNSKDSGCVSGPSGNSSSTPQQTVPPTHSTPDSRVQTSPPPLPPRGTRDWQLQFDDNRFQSRDPSEEARNNISIDELTQLNSFGSCSGLPLPQSNWYCHFRTSSSPPFILKTLVFFHAKLGMDVCPTVNNQHSVTLYKSYLTRPLLYKSPSDGSCLVHGYWRGFWWPDALPGVN